MELHSKYEENSPNHKKIENKKETRMTDRQTERQQ